MRATNRKETERKTKKLFGIMRPAFADVALSLSKMLGERVESDGAKTTSLADLASRLPLPNPRREMSSVLFTCGGDIKLEALFFLTSVHAEKLAHRLVGERGRGLDQLGTSAITEACNVMMGSLLTRLTKLYKLRVRASVPGYASDELQVLLESPIIDLASRSDRPSLIQVQLSTKSRGIVLNVWILLDDRSADDLVASAEALDL